MKKHILTIVLIVCVLCVILPVAAEAAEIAASGTCGDAISWTLDNNGVLTISGTGRMDHYSNGQSMPWKDYKSSITQIVVEDGVTGIGNYAFYGSSAATKLELPDSVTVIGAHSLENCTALTKVVIPRSMQKMGSGAFSGCSALTEVHIQDVNAWCGIEFANSSANPLYYAQHLYLNGELATKINLPNSVTSIGDYSFQNCVDLTSVSAYADIGDNVFSSCESLKEVILREGTSTIGDNAFDYCTSLEKITFPKTLTAIDVWSCFYNAQNLSEVHISDIAAWCRVTIGGSYACPMYYGAKLYLNGEEITDMVIPEGVAQIKAYTFYRCSGIKSVTFPTTLELIEENAFARCEGIEKVCISDLASWCEADTYAGGDSPLGYAGALYLNGELVTRVDVPEGVLKIGAGAFEYCKDITSVTIPDSVTSIGDSSFSGCTSLTEVVLGSNVATIGKYSFYGCRQLEKINMPASLCTIGQCAFGRCTALTDMQLPDGITAIEKMAFYGCTSLAQIQLPRTLESIESEAFAQCAFTSVVIPEKVDTIDSHAFLNCASLEAVYFLGDAPQTVASDIFNKCPTTATVYYPATASGWEGDTWKGQPAESWTYEKTSTATCTKGGVETISSAEHDLIYIRTVLPLGHEFLSWTVQKQPTAESTGLWVSKCENCCEIDTLEIPKLVETEQSSAITNNKGDLDYKSNPYQPYCANLVNSYMMENPDGGYIRLENAGDHVTVEYYDDKFNFISRRGLEVELSFFAGFYNDGNYNYIIFAQNNTSFSSGVAIFRVVKYSQDFCRIDSVDIFNSVVGLPCDAGSLRIAHYGNYLYMSTCFDSGHQLSYWVAVNTETMEVIRMSHGAVSHSFNQFIQVEGDKVFMVNHGDTYPRAAVLDRYSITYTGAISRDAVLEVMEFTTAGSENYNYTGCELGGYEISGSAHIIAGSSINQDGTVSRSRGQRNIFILATDKTEFSVDATTMVWLTDYADGDNVAVSTPHLVKISDEKLCVLWTEGTSLRYAFLGGNGQIISEIYTAEGALSDCKPIVADNKICWYVTSNSVPFFYTIDLSTPGTIAQTHEHSYTYSMTTEPTKDAAGELTGKCAYCEEADPVVLPVLTEQNYATEMLEEPGCTTEGACRYTWKETAYGVVTFEVKIPATGHAEVEDKKVEPNCTANGLTTGAHCSVCGTVTVKQTVINALGHDYQQTVTLPTCTSGGYTTHVCSRCKDTYTDSETSMLPHTYGEWKQTTAPTCTTEGEETRTCSCGASEKQPVDALGHSYGEWQQTTAPTCTTEGEETRICTCGASEKRSVEALGHSYGEWKQTTAPGCTTEGEETRTCTCGASEKRSVEALGHSYGEWKQTTGPSCTTEGEETRTCTCGASEYRPIDALDHAFGEWKQTTAPTCTTEGKETRACVCGASEQRSIDALSHDYYEMVTSPICTSGGYTVHICSACGDSYKDAYTDMIDHSYSIVPTNPTCTQKGYTTHTCSVCGDSYVDNYVDAEGHKWNDGEITKAPEIGAEGEKTYTCTKCSEVKTVPIPALDEEPVIPTMPDETEPILPSEPEVTEPEPTEPEPTEPMENPFTDVKEEEYYYDAVLWAVEEGITTGTSQTTFSPGNPCTRAQVVTFLWRAAGSPEPVSGENPFTDVKETDYFYEAVLWAVENEITKGVSATRFAPQENCTRAHVATFLWRTLDQPVPSSSDHPFFDIVEDTYYYDAVLWAVEEGITKGMSVTTFVPDGICTRAQIVTFLYRALA